MKAFIFKQRIAFDDGKPPIPITVFIKHACSSLSFECGGQPLGCTPKDQIPDLQHPPEQLVKDFFDETQKQCACKCENHIHECPEQSTSVAGMRFHRLVAWLRKRTPSDHPAPIEFPDADNDDFVLAVKDLRDSLLPHPHHP